jgi:quercetin dioxygenase-like cupin family protein
MDSNGYRLRSLYNKGYSIKILINKIRVVLFDNAMATMQKKNLDMPEETRTFEKGKIELANLGNVTIGRATLEPGWSWEKCVKPLVKTNSCQAPHTQYMVSGRMKVVMDNGEEEEFGPGDALVVPPGHNAWVVGNEPVVAVDFTGLKDYAKK